MLLAINRSIGKNLGFPDPCPTLVGPAVAVLPYLNMALHAMAVGFSPNVMLSGTPALNLGSKVPITMGDDPGMPGKTKQKGQFMTGSPVVKVNLLPGIHLMCLSTGNNMTNALGAVLAPGLTNVFYTYATGGAGGIEAAGERAGGPSAGLDVGTEGAPGAAGSTAVHRVGAGEIEALLGDMASVGRDGGPPVEHAVIAPGVGCITIRVFSADVPARVHGALRALAAEGMEILVIDLRGNPGGRLDTFIDLAGDFLPEGAEICAVVDADGDETAHHAGREMACSAPLVILVDGATASAAELFAGCLSAHGRALVMGGPTYGKQAADRFAAGPDGEVVRIRDRWVRLPCAPVSP